MATETLTQSLDLPSGVTLKNRVVKAAMQECLSGMKHNFYPTQAINVLYKKWSEGDYGLVITGNIMINKNWLGDVGDICVDMDTLSRPDEMAAWRQYAEAAQANKTVAVIQINHPGRQSPKGSGLRPSSGEGSQNLAPSSVPLNFGTGFINTTMSNAMFGVPKEMTVAEIERTVQEFINAAVVAREAGFRGVELHAAHGYLVSSFNNPKHNLRTDAYGGTPEKRLKFTLDILRGIRAKCPAPFILGIKLNSSDTVAGGLSEAEASQQVTQLATDTASQLDFIEVSGGNYETPSMAGPLDQFDSTQIHERMIVAPTESKTGASTGTSAGDTTQDDRATASARREALFLSAATQAKRITHDHNSRCAILVTGGFKSRTGAASAIASGDADLVGLARVTCLDPLFPRTTLLDARIPDAEARYPRYRIHGKRAFERLVPNLGAGVVTKWHVFQLWRISEGKTPLPERSIGRFILGLIFTWKRILGMLVTVGGLGALLTQLRA